MKLRAALQQCAHALQRDHGELDFEAKCPLCWAYKATAEALAEQAEHAQPVAWLVKSRGVFNTLPDAQASWKYHGARIDEQPVPLYTRAQQAEPREPLSDAQIDALLKVWAQFGREVLVRAIERAHGVGAKP